MTVSSEASLAIHSRPAPFRSSSEASPNDKINVGMIGTSARAQEPMQAILQRPKEVEIVRIVDA
jgi:hypothetical protein